MKSLALDPGQVSASAPRPSTRLGDLLISGDFITQDQLDQALKHQKTKGGRLGGCLIKLGFLTEEILHSVLSRQCGIDVIDPVSCEVDPDVLKLLPRDWASRLTILPIRREGNVLFVALSDPNDVVMLDEVKFRTGMRITPLLASEAQIREAIDKHYGSPKDMELRKVFDDLPEPEQQEGQNLQVVGEDHQELDTEALKSQSEEAPIIRLVNFILVDSLRSGASDIHIEPFEKELRVRFRVDGVLKTVMSPPVKLKDALTSRLKIMARLNISEKRVPQDGRIRIRTRVTGKLKDLDFRVSVLPCLFGEKIVLRLLDK
ncbi:MAG TPA: ATPase, T2SS/T4P/T4SS family, partial [Terriglobia bacterium]